MGDVLGSLGMTQLSPQKFREILVLLLYAQLQVEMGERDENTEMVMRELKVSRKWVLQGWERVDAILLQKETLDSYIEKGTTEYSLDRIPFVEKTILRIAIFELLFCPDTPPKVVIAEAIRLARKFSTKESARFINAVVDRVQKCR